MSEVDQTVLERQSGKAASRVVRLEADTGMLCTCGVVSVLLLHLGLTYQRSGKTAVFSLVLEK